MKFSPNLPTIRWSGALLLAALLPGCGGSEANSPDAAPPPTESLSVGVAQARQMPVDRKAEVVGTLLAYEQVSFTSKMSGTVSEVPFDFGDRVGKGQLLIALDPTESRIAVQRARAALAEALAWLGLPPDGDETKLEQERMPAVVQAATALADAKSKWQSADMLRQTRDIAEQRYLEVEKTVEMREAALAAARDQVRVQLATVLSKRAELALAEKKLADTRILAPFDGSVVARHVSIGEYVRDDAPLITLAQIHPLRLRGRVPETGAGAARPGISVEFSTDAFPGRTFPATVTSVSPTLDPASRTLVAEALVDNKEGLLKPGMFAKIQLLVATGVNTVMVPKEALLQFGGLTKLFAVSDEGAVRELAVETGVEADGWVEILHGAVQAGDRLAVSRLEDLASGVQVRFQ